MTKEEIGKQIEALRKECGVSTYELEQKGIHPSLPATIERGQKGYSMDSVVMSVVECCSADVDIEQLSYKEFKGGSKAAFELPLKSNQEIKGSPMVGDLVSSSLLIQTGFDGYTKTSVMN